uniref:Uncharacterized protein n=1 Tax=Aplanochytrium stocchinoi TaxID=215587 RepID=A0A7S3LP11_9STRA
MGKACTKCLEDTGLKGHSWGDGQRLGDSGGAGNQLTEEQRREQRLKAKQAAEARGNPKLSKPKPKPKPKPKQTEPTPKTSDESNSEEVDNENEKEIEENEEEVDESNLSEREKKAKLRAAAAAKRINEKDTKGLSKEKAEELRLKREKDREAGRDPPFGLASVSVPKLKKQLEFAKTLKA